MNREIKFRAWDTFNAQYFYSKNYENLGAFFKAMQMLIDGDNSLIFEQFIEIQDKNGRDVYDGDILTSLGKDVCVVKYKNELCGYFLEFYDADLDEMDFIKLNLNTLKFREVVGNIHENPELLNR